MNRKLKELQEKYEALKTENGILKREKEAFERVIGYYKRDFKQLLGTHTKQKKDYKELREEYNKLNNDYIELFTAKQETEKRLTETNRELNNMTKLFTEKRNKLIEYQDKYFGLLFHKIVHNKEKGTTVVWFEQDNKVIVKRRKGAKDDVYTAVAYAIVEKLYGSNTRFKKAVEDVKIR